MEIEIDPAQARRAEGAEAFRSGKKLGDNPHRRSTGAYGLWRIGYLNAKSKEEAA